LSACNTSFDSIAQWVSYTLNSAKISTEIALRASSHLSYNIKKDLFSTDDLTRNGAIGYLYEAAIYEFLLNQTLPPGYRIVAKGADAPVWARGGSKPGQDGLFYDSNGAILARGNGQDLGEFDLLITNDRRVAFAEIRSSYRNLKGLVDEIEYKKRFLGALFSPQVQSMLISCVDLKDYPKLIRLKDDKDNFFVVTKGVEQALSTITEQDVFTYMPNRAITKAVWLSKIYYHAPKYAWLHDALRHNITECLENNREPSLEGNFSLVKRVIMGYIEREVLENLLNQYSFLIGKKRMTGSELCYFPKAILSLNLPTFRPIVYLKVLDKPVFLKMGPSSESIFGFEGNIRKCQWAFFNWLESIDNRVEPITVDKIFKKYIAANAKKHKNFGIPDVPTSFY